MRYRHTGDNPTNCWLTFEWSRSAMVSAARGSIRIVSRENAAVGTELADMDLARRSSASRGENEGGRARHFLGDSRVSFAKKIGDERSAYRRGR